MSDLIFEPWEITECQIKTEEGFRDDLEMNLIRSSCTDLIIEDIIESSKLPILDQDDDFKKALMRLLYATL